MNCIVKLDCVSKCYVKGVTIIRDCSLEVYEGEFLTILGPSGCGKTTLLRMISGLEQVSKGKIYLDSDDVTALSAAVRPVNTVFQNFALFPHMTIEDNIGYGLKIKGVSKGEIKTRIKEMLELVQLTGYEKRKPSQLSGGEQQRVAIARGLINNPKVLLLDEPLSSLDLKLKKQMQLELKRLQRKLGITFIYVTHSQDEALTMSDRIVILNHGKIEQQGSPQDIYCHPNSLFVADFIGESNLLNGIIVKKTDSYVTVGIDKDYFLKVNDNSFEIGDEICLVIRPEDVQIQKKVSINSMEGIVREIIYNGNFTKLMIGLGKMELKVLVNSSEVFCKRRDHVFITFDASHCVLFRRNVDEKK